MADEQQAGTEFNVQVRERERALEEIRELGLEAYPHKFERTHTISEIVERFGPKTGDELEADSRACARRAASTRSTGWARPPS